ncbi:DNA-binding transcriptional regulator CsiR [Pseudomonas sp. W5-36]|uniref:DNA-binding transcriptional regulator CsiR n=1 Tax=Pseudomonas sp. W5-36 TaxID=3097455 RepID=UPI00397BA3C4
MESPIPRLDSAFSGYERLKLDIIRGVFKPGEKLLMGGLKERYQLGVGPLREALSQLVAEHLVVVISQKGYRVASISLQEMQDIYDARANLEAMIVGLAIERGDDTWEAQVLAHSHTLSKVGDVTSRDKALEIWDERHKAFHSAIAAGCGSRHLLQARKYLFDQAERYRHLWLTQTMFSAEALELKRKEHAALVEGILARDSVRVAALMRDHLMSPVPIIIEIMHRGANETSRKTA